MTYVRIHNRWFAGALTAILLAVLAGLVLNGAVRAAADRPIPMAEDGMLDLTGWDWEKDGVIALTGNWKFEWKSGGVSGEETVIKVPGFWHEWQGPGGARLPKQGYGIYRLTIKHQPFSEIMAIQMPNISTAYEMKVNGQTVQTRGVPGADAKSSKPYMTQAHVFLEGGGTITEIELAVSNFHHRVGGIRGDLVMGKAEAITYIKFREQAHDYFIAGCLLMMGLYHIALYVIRRSEPAHLLFAVLCFSVSLRMGLTGNGFLYQLLPGMQWNIGIRLEYLSILSGGWAGWAYYHLLYPQEIRRLWGRLFGGMALVLAAGTAGLSTFELTTWLWAFQIYLLLIIAVLIPGLIVSAYRRREGALLALLGVAVMAVAMVNDILIYNGWHKSIDLAPQGLLFLTVMNSLIISMRFSRTFDRAEQLSAELKEWNNRLEKTIEERTEELRKSYESLEAAKIDLERMEIFRRQLVSNISHDLRTPITLIQGYLEALRDGVIRDPMQQRSTIQLMLGKVEGLNGMIQDLFELSLLEARKVEMDLIETELGELKERLKRQYGRDLEEKQIHFSCELKEEAEASLVVQMDERRMDRVFANLIYNAVRYAPEGGWIRVTLRKSDDGRHAEAIVEDNGPGIDPDLLPHIFDRFYKKDKSRHSASGGSGLGLAIAREIVELHGGTIEAYNRAEGGGAFRIRLPLQLHQAKPL